MSTLRPRHPAINSSIEGFLILLAVMISVFFGIAPIVGAAAVVGIAAIMLIALFPTLGAVGFLFAALFDSIQILPSFGTASTVSKGLGAVVIVGWISSLTIGRLDSRRIATVFGSRVLILAALFVSWLLVSLEWTASFQAGVGRAITLGLLFVSTIVVATSITTTSGLRLVASFHVALSAVLGLANVVQYATGTRQVASLSSDAPLRVAGLLNDPNEFAMLQVVAFSVGLCLYFVHAHNLYRILVVLACIIIATSVLTTVSRGGTLSLAVVSFVWLLTLPRRWLPLMLVLAGGVAWTGLDLGVFDAVLQRSNSTARDPRFLLWNVALQLWEANPLIGLGLGSFPQAFYQNEYLSGQVYFRRPMVAHNMYLHIATETGIIGLLLFLLVVLSALWALWQASKVVGLGSSERNWIFRGYMIGLFGFLVGSFFLSAQYEKMLWMSIGLAIVASVSLRRQDRSSNVDLNLTSGSPLAKTSSSDSISPRSRRIVF